MLHVPGIWSQDQIDGWKKTTKAVHDKGGVIYLQMWALGRANPGNADVPKVVSASNVPFEGGATPEPLTVEAIKRYVELYAQAAKNSIEAGFDGVEIHSVREAPSQMHDRNPPLTCPRRLTDTYCSSSSVRPATIVPTSTAAASRTARVSFAR